MDQQLFRMEAATPEKLLEAFRILDPDGKGSISKDVMGKLMIEEGEPFTQVHYLQIKLIKNSAIKRTLRPYPKALN